jgi:hypothetical protein
LPLPAPPPASSVIAARASVQPVGRDAHDGAGLAHDRAEEHRLAGQQPELADGAPRPVHGDDLLALGAMSLDDRRRCRRRSRRNSQLVSPAS